MPEDVEAALAASRTWVDELGPLDAGNAIAFGSGAGWAAALEAALLLKEVAGVPTEGVETREGATSAMMALRPGDLVLSLSNEARRRAARGGGGDLCRAGGEVLSAPLAAVTDSRLAAMTTFPAAAVLSAAIGLGRGLDVDRPAWTDAYYRVARGPA